MTSPPTLLGECVVMGGNYMPVILNPSPFVTLSEAKGLVHRLRINSVKNLMKSAS